MKIIFLDIDGVLNSFATFTEIHNEWKLTGIRRVAIDLNKVLLLKEIVDNTGAKIVLSSSWRNFCKMKHGKPVTKNQNLHDLIEILNNNGLYIYDITPKLRSGIREEEIRKWMENKDIESFIVIDDDCADLQGFIGKELVKTSFIKTDSHGDGIAELSGLTNTHVEDAINKLNKGKKLIKK